MIQPTAALAQSVLSESRVLVCYRTTPALDCDLYNKIGAQSTIISFSSA